jgi:23S rRNA (guanine2445-N2)-methyltransferase / 23S rRNA (guanine2069-N7)-methyltransferase
MYHYFVSSAPNTEDLLADELSSLGFSSVKPLGRGVEARGTLIEGYRACLWSRIAIRVYLRLFTGKAETGEELRSCSASLRWEDHFSPDTTISVTARVKNSFIENNDYAALLVKDGIADRFVHAIGKRPSVSKKDPGLRFYSFIDDASVSFYLDLAGDSLHERGYRRGRTEAPLKENIASALLYRMRWPEIAAEQTFFIDPLCGSGTLVIEAALIALGLPPRANRERYGFHQWYGHKHRDWSKLVNDAEIRTSRVLEPEHDLTYRFFGFDRDGKAIGMATENCRRAGLDGVVRFSQCELGSLGGCLPEYVERQGGFLPGGLITTNAPYGERLGEGEDIHSLYQVLGRICKRYFSGWEAGVLTAETGLGKAVGLRAHKIHSIQNGPIACKLYHFSIGDENRFRPFIPVPAGRDAHHKSHIDDFANRLEKNRKKIGPWLEKNNITSYRLYDADLPEYAVAIDIYDSTYLHVQEYEPPPMIDRGKRYSRLAEIIENAPELTGIAGENIYVKVRRRMRQNRQYHRYAKTEEYIPIAEGECSFLINLEDFVDTGLFLDARFVRSRIRSLCGGKSFLNLFCYTATGTVYAAAGGAQRSLSIDSSNTYISWAKRNFEQNNITAGAHRLAREDCFSWLRGSKETFDIIFLGPPTFSNSKSRKETFDLQRDHVSLLKAAAEHLNPKGRILFLSNTKNFKMDEDGIRSFADLLDITRETFSLDFERSSASFHCWELFV